MVGLRVKPTSSGRPPLEALNGWLSSLRDQSMLTVLQSRKRTERRLHHRRLCPQSGFDLATGLPSSTPVDVESIGSFGLPEAFLTRVVQTREGNSPVARGSARFDGRPEESVPPTIRRNRNPLREGKGARKAPRSRSSRGISRPTAGTRLPAGAVPKALIQGYFGRWRSQGTIRSEGDSCQDGQSFSEEAAEVVAAQRASTVAFGAPSQEEQFISTDFLDRKSVV